MRKIYVREYTWGLSTNVFKTREAAEEFDCMNDDLVRVVEFEEVGE